MLSTFEPIHCYRQTRMSIDSGKFVFYYLARDNLCFLALCEESYPKRSGFMYLEEISDLIMQELYKEHGDNVGNAEVLIGFER